MLRVLLKRARSIQGYIFILFAIIGVITLLLSFAATPFADFEPELEALSGCVNSVDSASASKGKHIEFGSTEGCLNNAGAKLPITYNINDLAGNKRYVDDAGSDSTGNGSIGAPYATIAKAYSASAAGDSIIIRDGNYSEGGITINQNKNVKIIAYPGEIPVFNGAQSFGSGWVSEGSNSYHAYSPQPVTDGSGISFTTGQGLNGDGVGKYPDQVWIGQSQLQQVSQKSSLATGKFWVDGVNNRLYLTTTDAAKTNIEASNKSTFMTVNAPNTAIEGLKIKRYSNTAADYGVIKFMATADASLLKNVELSDSAFIGVAYLGDSHINTGSTVQYLTLTNSNWMGLSVMYTEGFSIKNVRISGMNLFDEFTTNIQAGAVKTSRTRNTKVINSVLSDNDGPGLWFDQSNYNIQVANNRITNNASAGVFFEISDNLYLINNYISASGSARAVKMAGSSGLKLVNNTLVGGSDVVGVYVDSRSQPGCSDPSKPLCANSYDSDRDTVRPLLPTMTWIPSIDLMINNIIAYPTGAGYCGNVTALCITGANGSTTVELNQVIHPANSSLGLPQTLLDGNVYANGTAFIVITKQGNYTSLPPFTSALAGSPVNIPGLETNGKSGNSWITTDGHPTTNLTNANGQAVSVPTDSAINTYLPAGQKHFGVSYY